MSGWGNKSRFPPQLSNTYPSLFCFAFAHSFIIIVIFFIIIALYIVLVVGSWAWNWMEPPLGQISFFLLCLGFARSQIANLGVRPYTAKLKALRADKIVRKYPQYDATLLADYSKSVNFY